MLKGIFRKVRKLLFIFPLFQLILKASYYKFRGKKIVIIFNLFKLHYTFVNSTIKKLKSSEKLKLFIVNDFKSSKNYDSEISQFQLPSFFLKFLRGDALVTAASSINSRVRPKSVKTLIHLLHSPVSTHYVYLNNTFNSYDVVFCVGDQHKKELSLIYESKNLKGKLLYSLGYGRLDHLLDGNEKYLKKFPENKSVLIAPSWHVENFLKLYGELIIGTLLKKGLRIILRPHPLFEHHQPEVLQNLRDKFGANELFIFDNADKFEKKSKFDGFYESEFLITDWSGISFEFAAVKEKPVIFMDTTQKIQNAEAKKITIEPVESFYRDKIGFIVGKKEVSRIGEFIDRCQSQEISTFAINANLDKVFSNRTDFGSKASEKIIQLLNSQN